jgi:hypothetical protein
MVASLRAGSKLSQSPDHTTSIPGQQSDRCRVSLKIIRLSGERQDCNDISLRGSVGPRGPYNPRGYKFGAVGKLMLFTAVGGWISRLRGGRKGGDEENAVQEARTK